MTDQRWQRKYDRSNMTDQRWQIKYERWQIKYDRSNMTDQIWQTKDDRSNMKDDRSNMKDGRWNINLASYQVFGCYFNSRFHEILQALSREKISSQRRPNDGLLQNKPIMHWHSTCVCGTRINYQTGWTAICKCRQNSVFAQEEGRDVVLLKHQLSQFFSFAPDVPLWSKLYF